MMVFRFLAGLGGSAPLAIGSGVLADTFVAEQRGVAVSSKWPGDDVGVVTDICRSRFTPSVHFWAQRLVL